VSARAPGAAGAGEEPPPRALVELPADPTIERILVLRWSAIGDCAIASAAFEDIARAFPGREIHLSTHPPCDALFRHDPRFARVHAIDFRSPGRRLAGVLEWLDTVARQRFDLLIDLQGSDRSRILTTALWLRGGQCRWRLGNRRGFPYNVAPDPLPEPLHALARIRHALAAGGIATGTDRPVIHVPPELRARAADKRRRHRLEDGGYAVLLPGCQAAGYLKRWGAERYRALAEHLHQRGIARVVLLGGPDEREECRRIATGHPWVVDLCGQTELLELLPLVEGARAICANDTGTAHLLAATGRPMLVLFGPTDPRTSRPAGPRVMTMQAELPCINCYRKHCDHHSCMRELTVARVAARLATVL